MGTPTVSLVIVSRDRPDALALCLTGVAQLDHAAFEVIVVTCPAGRAVVAARADAGHIKVVPCDVANISLARNLGVARAAGDIVAFLDDDAVPEPSWLRHLTAPFDHPEVAACGGYVRGRNGIGFQWRARTVDATGAAHPIEVAGTDPVILRPDPGRAIKTEGTNMAVRRDVLATLGGFDPAFRFYLDETDLNMRLAGAGHATAIVPLAQVHHGYAPSARRHADRSPRDLTEIGASFAAYLRKHLAASQHKATWLRFRNEQRIRLLRLMQRGPLGPDDVVRLMRGLDRGWRDGLARPIADTPPLRDATDAFQAFPARPGARETLYTGRIWHKARLYRTAQQAVARGEVVTLLRLSPTALYHRLQFRPEGFWEQTGGQFGRSDRTGPLFQPLTLRQRIAKERSRLAQVRDF